MGEKGGANIEIAHKLNEGEGEGHHKGKWVEMLEIVEAIVLAMVAIATAWSGYQAARFDGLQDEFGRRVLLPGRPIHEGRNGDSIRGSKRHPFTSVSFATIHSSFSQSQRQNC